MSFSFMTTEDTYRYCEEVVECLQTYFDKPQREAFQLVNNYWRDEPIFDDYDLRLHEFPYYWAVAIYLRASGDERITGAWWKDPSLWPPPQDYLKQFS